MRELIWGLVILIAVGILALTLFGALGLDAMFK